jgi:hypothetical protein
MRLSVRFWWDDWEGMGFTQDVSETGLLVETPRDLEIGTRIHLEVTGDNLAFFANGVVVRKKQYPRQARSLFKPALGVRIEKLTEALEHAKAAGKAKTAPRQEKPDAAGKSTGKAPVERVAKKAQKAEAQQAEKPVAQETGPPPAKPTVSAEKDAPVYETTHLPMQVDLRDPERLAEIYEEDVKHGGLRVRTTEIPGIDEDVVVPVLLPEPHGRIDCIGTVVKILDDLPGFALRLHDVDAVRARLIEIIRSR